MNTRKKVNIEKGVDWSLMNIQKARLFIEEWIANISSHNFYLKYEVNNSLFMFVSDEVEYTIILDEEMGVCIGRKHEKFYTVKFPIPNDRQSTCALLSHFIDGLPLDFNMNKWTESKTEEE